MHRALYRKYRPADFMSVCGQEHISQTLKNQIAAGKPSHAYLFTGSRGTGKTSTAKILAKAVNCLDPHDGEPCGECEICRGIDNGTVLDVSEIDAASNNGVDNIRDLREKIAYAPAAAKYKVYIIDEVHMLSDGAFNALLKTLEEPPAHAIFILATTEVHKIPATILSRCQRYDFSRIPAGVIAARLRYICDQEGFSAEDSALSLIAKLADGGMRDAVSMLDLCAGISGSVTEEGVAKAVGLIDKRYVFDIAAMIEQRDAAALLGEIDRLYNASCDMERLCAELISHYRDLMVAKTTKDFRELITATAEELEEIDRQSRSISFENMLYAVSALSDCVKTMKSGGNKRIAVETSLIKLCTPALDNTPAALSARIAAIEAALKGGNLPIQPTGESPATTAAEPASKEPQGDVAERPECHEPDSEKSADGGDSSGEEIRPFTYWAEVMEILRASEPMLHAVMGGSRAFLRGDFVLIDAPNSQFRSLINGNRRLYEAIRSAVLSASGMRCKIGPFKRKAAVADAPSEDPLERFTKNNSDLVEVE